MKVIVRHKLPASPNRQRGTSLAELMIAMLVLAVGLAGITILVTTSIGTDNRNSRDTTATMLAQLVIEEIGAQDPNAGATTVPITDCAEQRIQHNSNGWGHTEWRRSYSRNQQRLAPLRLYRSDSGSCRDSGRLPNELCGLFNGRRHPDHLRRPLERDDDRPN